MVGESKRMTFEDLLENGYLVSPFFWPWMD